MNKIPIYCVIPPIIFCLLLALGARQVVSERDRLQVQVTSQSQQIATLQSNVAWFNATDPVTFFKHEALSVGAFMYEHHIKNEDTSGPAKKLKVILVYEKGYPKK